jgi:hypothetical protein
MRSRTGMIQARYARVCIYFLLRLLDFAFVCIVHPLFVLHHVFPWATKILINGLNRNRLPNLDDNPVVGKITGNIHSRETFTCSPHALFPPWIRAILSRSNPGGNFLVLFRMIDQFAECTYIYVVHLCFL